MRSERGRTRAARAGQRRRRPRRSRAGSARDHALNGVSVAKIELDQEGDLTVTFDLPIKQRSSRYELFLSGSRTFDVYESPELLALVRRLFAAIRRRLTRYRNGEKPACSRCGDAPCCRAYNVLIDEADIDRLRGRRSRRAFIRAYADPAVDWSGDYTYQLKEVKDEHGERCVFLAPDRRGRMRCRVYGRRPRICRDFDVAVCPDFDPGGAPQRKA